MEIRRTANAGILLKLDGVSLLLDGVCREEYPYPATPPEERAALSESYPDVIAFTHAHNDHYDPDFAAVYQKQTNGVVLGPGELPGCRAVTEPVKVGNVIITPIKSRHIGVAGKTTDHVSFLIRGRKCVLFTGDASVLQWKNRQDLPAVDVVIAPYAYAATPSALELVKALGARELVVLHLPQRTRDPYGLWAPVDAVLEQGSGICVYIPDLCQTLFLP